MVRFAEKRKGQVCWLTVEMKQIGGGGRLTGDVAGTPRVSVLKPGPANAFVLLVDLQIDIPQPLWNPYSQVDTRVACANDPDLDRPEIFDWFVLDGEWRLHGTHVEKARKSFRCSLLLQNNTVPSWSEYIWGWILKM